MEIADFEGAEGMENQGHTVIVWYFAIINLAAFLIYGWDKLCAKRHAWRVSE